MLESAAYQEEDCHTLASLFYPQSRLANSLQSNNLPRLDFCRCGLDPRRCQQVQPANFVFLSPDPGCFLWCTRDLGQLFSRGKLRRVRVPRELVRILLCHCACVAFLPSCLLSFHCIRLNRERERGIMKNVSLSKTGQSKPFK